MREFLALCFVDLALRSFLFWEEWDDAHHHHHSVICPCTLHVGHSLAMLYFHPRVKKRTSRLVDCARIQNVLLWQQLHANWITASDVALSRVFLRVREIELESVPYAFQGTGLFDSTLGFPGEGPRWSIISANVDSFAANYNCLQWNADAFMLQEARIADSNMAEAQRKAGMCNFHLFCSQTLQKQRASNGTFRVPCGGTATCAHRELTQLFEEKADISGCWTQLRSSARVTATWHQVSPGVKLLAFNFYGIANAASERAKFGRNNELLDLIFTVAAQFGDVPILLGGDFQMEPGMYPAAQLALDHCGWSDPLLRTDAQGDVVRPSTFFQHSAVVDGEGESSIDGILMNRTALTALIDIQVLDHRDRQQRPVQATFAWDRILQVGSIMQMPAKMNLERVQRHNPDDPGCPVNGLMALVNSCGMAILMASQLQRLPMPSGMSSISLPPNSCCSTVPAGGLALVCEASNRTFNVFRPALLKKLRVILPLLGYTSLGRLFDSFVNWRTALLAQLLELGMLGPSETLSIVFFVG